MCTGQEILLSTDSVILSVVYLRVQQHCNMTNEAQVNHLDQALSKIESLITLLSSNTHGRNAESRSGEAPQQMCR